VAQREAKGVPLCAEYGTGTYRRRILVIASDGAVTGELEDDFHHFRATLEHDGQRVTRATGEALRVPWTTCPGAVRPIALLEGLPLTESLRAAAKHTNPRAQCTHLFDSACLAVAFVAAHPGSRGERTYDAAVPDRIGGRTSPTLAIDGREVLRWEVDGNQIAAPLLFAGQALTGGGFGRWVEGTLPPPEAVHAIVLQKALFIAAGRRYVFDEIDRAAQFGEAVGGACHTFSPEFEPLALRVYGSVRDFTDAPDTPLANPPRAIEPDALLRSPAARARQPRQ
jgi:hypothetical protein